MISKHVGRINEVIPKFIPERFGVETTGANPKLNQSKYIQAV